LKREFPQEVRPVSDCPSFKDEVTEQPKQTLKRVNRKARTSAAMIGLALSMGASSLLLPRQDDGAIAAESLSTESTITVVPSMSQDAVPSSGDSQAAVESKVSTLDSLSNSTTVEHVVREGQTLIEIAQSYEVAPASIATLNRISIDAVIKAGQVLQIPVALGLMSDFDGSADTRNPVVLDRAAIKARIGDTISPLQVERDQSLNRLRQEREKLQRGLAELRFEESIGQFGEASLSGSLDIGVQLEGQSTVHVPPVGSEDQFTRSDVEGRGLNVPQVLEDEAEPEVSQSDAVPIASSELLATSSFDTSKSQADSTQEMQVASIDTSTTYLHPSSAQPSSASSTSVYRVKPGDTIAQIARNFGVSQSVLIQVNQLRNPNFILVGQEIRIPIATTTPITSTVPPSPVTVATRNISALPQSEATPVATESSSDASGAAGSTSGAMFATEFVAPDQPEGAAAQSAAIRNTERSQSQIQAQSANVDQVDQSTAPVASSSSVDALLSDVAQLRNRHQGRQFGDQSSQSPQQMLPIAAASLPDRERRAASRSSRVNPELRPAVVESDESELSLRQRVQQPVIPSSVQAERAEAEEQLVATAPLGSENYEPLIQPLTGQLVSPDLPPLPHAEAYLPEGSISFDGYIWPARGVLTSGYGWRWGRMHRGIDIAAPVGTPVYAAASGVVEFSGWNSGGYGYMVEVRHPDGSMTRYAHNSRNIARVGQQIAQGEQIAEVGSTGYSTGPHVHFEIHLPNQGTVNPIAYLSR